MIELLENRRLLSATAFLNTTTLQINGTKYIDNIEINFVAKKSATINGFDIIVRSNGGDIGKFDSDDVKGIIVNLAAKDDNLIVTVTGETADSIAEGKKKDFDQRLLVNAGAGDDYVYINPDLKVGALINGQAGHDTLQGGGDDDTIYGGAGNDQIYGDGGDDMLFGNAGNDALYGGSGDDFLSGGKGFDIAIGGTDADSTDGTNEVENL
jgi:Ca2+-binding RTX toxin-like protein